MLLARYSSSLPRFFRRVQARAYTLKVEIADADLKHIKTGQYNLCLTKSVIYQARDVPGNVVFLDALTQDIAPKLEFTWEERYQTYMMYNFEARIPLKTATNAYDIEQGMKAVFDDHGSARTTGSPDKMKPIVIENNWKAGGRIAIANYNLATQKFATTFVSLPTLLESANNLTPIPKIGVFFHAEHVASSMFDTSQTRAFPVDLTGKTSVTIRYESGKWNIMN